MTARWKPCSAISNSLRDGPPRGPGCSKVNINCGRWSLDSLQPNNTRLEAVEFAKILCPDVAILDIQMPRLNGLDAAKEILRHCPNAIIVSDSVHDMNLFVGNLKKIGVKGFVDKLWLGTELLSTVDAVLNGDTHFPALTPVPY